MTRHREIREYAKDHTGQVIENDLEEEPSDLKRLIETLQSFLSQGYTSREVDVYHTFNENAVARIKYYKTRQETDEEIKERVEVENKRRRQLENRQKVIAGLTPEQKEALNLT